MAPMFSKEVILAGCVDHLCLVCETYLRTEEEVTSHVGTAGHKKKLNTTQYVEKFRDDRIRKVKKLYFCEFCNVLVSTISSAALHVEEHRHNENKLRQIMSRSGDVIVAGNITVQEAAWHGFVDENTCSVCNEECEEAEVHKNQSKHVIELIQSKVIETNGSIYRKIDDSAFHCLTCNQAVANITKHLDETQHKELLQNNIKETSSKREEDAMIEKQKVDFLKSNKVSKKVTMKKCSLQKVPMRVFIDTQILVRNMLGTDIIVNNKYCISVLSFQFFVTISQGLIRCQVCEVNFPFQDTDDHLNVARHERALQEVPVLVHKDLEFIREIRSGTFQCGYCNIIDSWHGMEDHLRSMQHRDNKTFAQRRLSTYLPQVQQMRLKQHMQNELMRFLLS